MSYTHRLTNGYVIVLLSPREAVCVRDELLDPQGFPWQSTESQMVALDVKSQLDHILLAEGAKDLNEASQLLYQQMMEQGAKPLADEGDDDDPR